MIVNVFSGGVGTSVSIHSKLVAEAAMDSMPNVLTRCAFNIEPTDFVMLRQWNDLLAALRLATRSRVSHTMLKIDGLLIALHNDIPRGSTSLPWRPFDRIFLFWICEYETYDSMIYEA